MPALISFYFIFTILVAVATYYSNVFIFIKVLILSLLIILGLGTYKHYTQSLGAPIVASLPSHFIYQHHVISATGNIIVWVDGKTGNRLYNVPYQRELAEQLEKAKRMTAKGRTQQGVRSPDKKGRSDEYSFGEYITPISPGTAKDE